MTDTPRVAPRPPKLSVVVTRSTEAIDFDAWAAQYVRAVLAVDAAIKQAHQEAA